MVSQNSPSVSSLTFEVSHLCRLHSKLWCPIATGHVCWSPQGHSSLVDGFWLSLYCISYMPSASMRSFHLESTHVLCGYTKHKNESDFLKIDSQHLLRWWHCALRCLLSKQNGLSHSLQHTQNFLLFSWALEVHVPHSIKIPYVYTALCSLQNAFIPVTSYDPL